VHVGSIAYAMGFDPCYDDGMRYAALLPLILLAACSSTPKAPKEQSPFQRVERFYAAPVIYDFEVPADWELPPGEWDEKTADFTDAFLYRLEVSKRVPISRLDGDVPPGGAKIQLIVTEVDLGFYAGIVRKPAICWGELIFTDSAGVEFARYDVEFRTPGDAGYQWYTYGGRLASAHDEYAVDVISLIQRERS
jgi:hypothetical protein